MSNDLFDDVRPNLVFTSAGEHHNVQQWLDGETFDIYVTSYVEKDFELKDRVKYVSYRKGGKFQNLHHLCTTNRSLLERYAAVMVMDDDIKISGADIDKIFGFRENIQADVLQPAFDHRGKISHNVTSFNPFTSYRITNFVEVTCPVFRGRYLLDFLDVFDPRANGGGVDFWFCNYTKSRPKIAIVDEVTCLNPWDVEKGGAREIDKFQSRLERNAIWKIVKRENNLNFGDVAIEVFEYKFKLSARQMCKYIDSKFSRYSGKIFRAFRSQR